MLVILLLIFTTIFLLGLYVNRVTAWKNSPPGPKIYPLIGSVPALAKLSAIPHFAFHQLSEAFGPVVRILVGVDNMMILSGYQEIKEAMNNEELDDRGSSITAALIMFGLNPTPSISLFAHPGASEEPKLQWRELRRFTLKSLRDLGFGKSASEDAILHETGLLMEGIKKMAEDNNGEAFLGQILSCASLNVVWNLVGATRYDYNDADMHTLLDYSDAFMQMGKDVTGKPFGSMPFLRFFPPYKAKFDYLSDCMVKFKGTIRDICEERNKHLEPGNPTCYIDDFLERSRSDESGIFTLDQLMYSCMDIFIAGSETTGKTQEFMIAMMMHHPDIQRKVQEELDAVANGRELLSLNDKENLPYTEATLNEVWRFCNVAPLSPPRTAKVPVKFGKYTIPAHTLVIYNTYTLNMDKQLWGDPENFRPERFLEEGKFKPHDRLFPFGIGRRRCLGETMARMENFIFLANLLLHFSFSCVNGSPPSLEPESGFTNGPHPFVTRITSRK